MFINKKQYRGASDLLTILECVISAIVIPATFVIGVLATVSGEQRPAIGVPATLASWRQRPGIGVLATKAPFKRKLTAPLRIPKLVLN